MFVADGRINPSAEAVRVRRVVTCSLLSFVVFLGMAHPVGAVVAPAVDSTTHPLGVSGDHTTGPTRVSAVDGGSERPPENNETTDTTVGTSGTADTRNETAAAVADESLVEQRVTLSLTPDDPGRVRVVYRYEFPSYLRSFRARLDPRTTLRSTDGFAHENDTFVWDGTTAQPTITVDYRVNQTTADTGPDRHLEGAFERRRLHDAQSTAETGLLFADTGAWALLAVPRYSADWRYPSDRPAPTLRQRVRTDGPGVVGTDVAFLGRHTVSERTAHGQQFRLIVPRAADLRPSPAAVLNATSAASDALRVGGRDERVSLFAAPAGPDWAVRGLQTGETDAWVRADEPVTTPGNVWLHEYVHTRQSYTTTDETRWVTEGSADYYAASLSLRQGLVDFEAFARTLQRGRVARVENTVLTRRETWGTHGNYHVGALVAGTLDRRVRETGSGSFDRVVAAMNDADDPFGAADLAATLRGLGGDSLATTADRYTTTTDRPPVWNQSLHATVFETAALTTETAPPRVDGPYRNGTLAKPVVVPGEAVTIDTTVANAGSVSGRYRLVATLDGDTAAVRTGELAAGASTTATVTQPFTEPGTYTLVVGDTTLNLTVATPATPRVDAVSVDPQAVAPGESVTVRATVSNPADRPADAPITVRLGDRRVTTRQLRLGPGETTTLTTTVTPDSAGTSTVRAGNRTATVRATTPTPSPTAAGPGETTPSTPPETDTVATRRDTTATDGPAIGAGVAVLALLATALLRRLRD